MKRLITRPRSLLLVAALTVVAAMCTVPTAQAASFVSETVVPAAPSNLTATAVSPDSVELTWTNNAPNQSGVVISLDGVDSVDVQGATVSSYTGDGLSPGTKYWFYIASKIYGTPGDPTGYGNTQSAWVGPVYVTTPSTSAPPSAKTGKTLTYNSGEKGNCTWWAINEFHQFDGLYPDTLNPANNGNAKYWATNAGHNGWTVTSTPRVDSIAVFQPGANGAFPPDGHVAWVTAVSGSQITVTEMNFEGGSPPGGFGKVDTRTLTPASSVLYILAP
jgi:surface antigen